MNNKIDATKVLTVLASIGFGFLGGLLTMEVIKVNEEQPITVQEEVLNVTQETEVHYYVDGATLITTTIYYEDGSIDTYTEYSYPVEVEQDYHYQ